MEVSSSIVILHRYVTQLSCMYEVYPLRTAMPMRFFGLYIRYFIQHNNLYIVEVSLFGPLFTPENELEKFSHKCQGNLTL